MLPAKRYNRQNATIHRRTKRGKGLPYIVAFCRRGQAKRYNKKKKEEKKRKRRKKEEKKKKRGKREKKRKKREKVCCSRASEGQFNNQRPNYVVFCLIFCRKFQIVLKILLCPQDGIFLQHFEVCIGFT